MTLTVTTANFKIGVCEVSFDGHDLGPTEGPVNVKLPSDMFEAFIEAYGKKAPIAAWHTGEGIEVDMELSEENYSILEAIWGAWDRVTDGLKEKLTIGAAGPRAVATGALVLHPLTETTTDNGNLTLYKGYCTSPGDWSYATGKTRTRKVVFKAMVDLTRDDGDMVGCFGDSTAGDPPTVTGSIPSSGVNSGTTAVHVIGTNLIRATAIHLSDAGNTALTTIVAVSDTQLTAVVPASVVPGDYEIKVTTPGGTNTTSDHNFVVTAP
jgi:hypothetical protein